MLNKKNTLHLVLKRKWWDMIKSGEKREEYRLYTPYWRNRLLISESPLRFVPYKYLVFHLGYTNNIMKFKINSIRYGIGNPVLGSPVDPCFIISFIDV